MGGAGPLEPRPPLVFKETLACASWLAGLQSERPIEAAEPAEAVGMSLKSRRVGLGAKPGKNLKK